MRQLLFLLTGDDFMARKQADAFNQFYNEAVKPLKTRVTNLENNSSSDTVVSSSGVKVSVGATQPTDTNVIWINTSKYGGE